MINCDKCGLCCKFCDKLPELNKFDRGDGVCIHLKEDNTCAIYEDRPEICNTKKTYIKGYSKLFSEKEY